MRALVAVAAVLLLVGCTSAEPTDPGLIDDGMGVPLPMPIDPAESPTLLVAEPATAGHDAMISGVLSVNVVNCVTLDDHLLVAPAGSMVDGSTISIAGYGSFALGDSVSLGGAVSEGEAIADLDVSFAMCVPGETETISAAYVAPHAR